MSHTHSHGESNIPHPAGEFMPHDKQHGTFPDASKSKPGVLHSKEDKTPYSHLETYPVGTELPAQNTFSPNPSGEFVSGSASAADTLPGATSADVDRGLGKPTQYEEATEERHEGQKHRKHAGAGYEGVGTNSPGTETDLRRLQDERPFGEYDRPSH